MRPRGSAHADAVSRRLELLSAELAAVRGEPAGSGPVEELADPGPGPPDPADPTGSGRAGGPEPVAEPWAVPDLHTHVRADRRGPPPPGPGSGEGTGPDVAVAEGPLAGSVIEPPHEPVVASPEVAPRVPLPGRHARRRQRWSPGGLLAGRVALGPAQVAVLAVVVAVTVTVTAWWVVRDRGEPLAMPSGPAPGASPAALATGVEPTTTGASPGAEEVVVDVAGKVRHPGIVVLDPGSRVVDALEAAGGARPGADLTGLNLARLLVDGEQILVGVPAAPGLAASAAGSPGPDPGRLVNLNSAGLEELDTLPGVGPVTAQSILDWRAANGGFQSVDQLLDVDGIGEKTLADLAPLVTV